MKVYDLTQTFAVMFFTKSTLMRIIISMSHLYNPNEELQKNAYISSMDDYDSLVHQASENPEEFWADRADEAIDWIAPYDKVLNDTEAPFYKWFEGGKLNISQLCLDRHIESRGNQAALIWEGESGEVRTYTYRELLNKVNQLANLMKSEFGVKKGDRVALYMPMIPEAQIAMLACARIGAIHVVVFGGFSSEVLGERIADTDAKLIITADGASRHGKPYLLKPVVDEALEKYSTGPKVLIVEHNHQPINYVEGRDYSYNEMTPSQDIDCDPEPMDSEDTSFILHTSGSTGKPKGIQHSIAGYMLWAQWTTKHVFDLHDGDVFWCTADIGWITGHTYATYGPLAIGSTTFVYEGVPTYPDNGRWWQMIEKHGISQFYTAPTAIRMLHKSGPDEPKKYDLSRLKVLGTVGEPIDPDAWQWYRREIGGNKCPIVDTWWQTENGGHLIAPLPGATPTKPGSATLPLPGISVEVLNEDGSLTPRGEKGLLCVTRPWPSMLRGVWGSPERYSSTYFDPVKKDRSPVYFSGDGAYIDEDGYIIVTGRVDDVINVSGHRIGTAEIESVIADHKLIAESAIVSKPDDIRGEQIVAFVVLGDSDDSAGAAGIIQEINLMLREKISAMIKISEIVFVPGLPKTRSGKILRRILRNIANNEPITADISTLEDPAIVSQIQSATSS